MATNVKILRLVNGQEVIAELLNEDETGIKIKNPVMVMVVPNKADPNSPNIGLGPWANFSDDKEFILNKATVIAIMNPMKDFLNEYNRIFGGLVLPSNPSLNLNLPVDFQLDNG